MFPTASGASDVKEWALIVGSWLVLGVFFWTLVRAERECRVEKRKLAARLFPQQVKAHLEQHRLAAPFADDHAEQAEVVRASLNSGRKEQ